MSALLKDAEEIFATAQAAGANDCDYSIVVGHDGGIHLIADADWALESLRTHYGASAAFRVKRGGEGVRVEARNAAGSCLLTAARPERALLPSLADFPRYLTIQ